ncbi:hypothetical protein RZS08_51715, partial [Arthrospira platensis SPKY1]|nr:hypothetical protein [Arthrospira platensis SPKY1]
MKAGTDKAAPRDLDRARPVLRPRGPDLEGTPRRRPAGLGLLVERHVGVHQAEALGLAGLDRGDPRRRDLG